MVLSYKLVLTNISIYIYVWYYIFEMTLCLKVFSLNCWGLEVVSRNRKSRISAIAEFLATNRFDVACLQEVWKNDDYLFIKEKVSNVLPFGHYFYSGVTGSGICILSKHYIEETYFHQWSVNGYIHKLHHGDWWGGKGIGLCRLKIENGAESYKVNIYSTHLHAEYNRASDDYQAHRVLQAYDTAQFISLTSSSADLVILAGDLNTEPRDLPYRVLLTVPGLTDAYTQVQNIPEDMYATCENCKNSYTPRSLVKQNVLGKRIDYIMFSEGQNVKIDLKNYSLPLPPRVPNRTYSYSDHEAILVELSLKKEAKPVSECFGDDEKAKVLNEGIELCRKALNSINRTKNCYWLGVALLFISVCVSFALPSLLTDQYLSFHSTFLSILRIIFSILMIFCFLMATLWHKIEKHGILSGKLSMEVAVNSIQNCRNS